MLFFIIFPRFALFPHSRDKLFVANQSLAPYNPQIGRY
jgi:hypothetical protein